VPLTRYTYDKLPFEPEEVAVDMQRGCNILHVNLAGYSYPSQGRLLSQLANLLQ
jgi:hypothetical protein